jgi:hypothetical protein
MGSILAIHGELRWFVVLLAVVIIVKNVWGLVQKRPYTKLDRMLMIGFAALMGLNLLMGLILLFGLGGGLPTYRLEHALTMLVAIGVAASASRWAKHSDSMIIYRNNLIVMGISIVLVVVGVMSLRGGWVW